MVYFEEVNKQQVGTTMQQSILLAISFLLKDLEDVFYELVYSAEDQKYLLHLQSLSVVVQVLKGD